MIDAQALPALPEGSTVAEQAVVSVCKRRFHDHTPLLAAHARLSAQMLRLVEEAGEYDEARRLRLENEKKAEEVADVFIVACQIAWLTDMPLRLLEGPGTNMPATTIAIEVGQLARAIRKYDGSDAQPIHTAVWRVCNVCKVVVGQYGLKLEDVVTKKLSADEQRGALHMGQTA